MSKRYIKEINKKDAERGRNIIEKLGKIGEAFKLMALGKQGLEVELEVAFSNIKNFLGDKYLPYVKEGKKPNELFDVKTEQGANSRKKLIALQTDFYTKSLKFIEITRDMRKVYDELKSMRKQRSKYSEKMFKAYKLDQKKSYRFEFEELKIYEVEPDIPEGVRVKK